MNKNLISGWGNNKSFSCNIAIPNSINAIQTIIKDKKKIIARGLGRSYGDSSIQKNCVVELRNFNKIISFNKKNGTVKVQAGISLKCLLEKIIPNGWFVPVSPGTKYVTLGGMVASNVHGKNQHLDGCLINHILSIKLLHKDKIIKITKSYNKDLFYATCGGMGLTGIILEVKIKLIKIKSNRILQKNIFFNDLKNLIKTITKEKDFYSVAWLDCFSLKKDSHKINSILYLGQHEKKIKLLANFKFSKQIKIYSIFIFFFRIFFNKFFIKLFNLLKFNYEKIFFKKKSNYIQLNDFFYPLDKFKNWNELYGKKGFVQYQFAIPYSSCDETILKILKILNQNGLTPYLAVLKNMKKDIGLINFSIDGISLAMDIPFSTKIFKIFPIIDKIVILNKGKIYLTKDSILKKENYQRMYKNHKNLKKIRKIYNLENFESSQSKRLGI